MCSKLLLSATRMREVLAEYFERLIRIVNAYDGSVVALIGDAMLAAWFVEANQNGADGRLTHVTQRALLCTINTI